MKSFIKNIKKAKILINMNKHSLKLKLEQKLKKYNKIDMIIKPINQSINLSIYLSIN